MEYRAMIRYLGLPLIILLFCASPGLAAHEITDGQSWLWSTDAEQVEFVTAELGTLAGRGVAYERSPGDYVEAVSRKFYEHPELADAGAAGVLAAVIYEQEPTARPALDKLGKGKL